MVIHRAHILLGPVSKPLPRMMVYVHGNVNQRLGHIFPELCLTFFSIDHTCVGIHVFKITGLLLPKPTCGHVSKSYSQVWSCFARVPMSSSGIRVQCVALVDHPTIRLSQLSYLRVCISLILPWHRIIQQLVRTGGGLFDIATAKY